MILLPMRNIPKQNRNIFCSVFLDRSFPACGRFILLFPSEKQKNRKESKNFCEIRRISN